MGTKPMTVSEAIQTLRTLEGTWAAFRTLGDALTVAQDADTLRIKAEKAATDADARAARFREAAENAEREYAIRTAQARSDADGVIQALSASYLEKKTQIDADLTARTNAAQSRIDELLFQLDKLHAKRDGLLKDQEELEGAVARLKTTFESLKHQAESIRIDG